MSMKHIAAAVDNAGKGLAAQVAAIQQAQKNGDTDALFDAVKKAAKPAAIVKKAGTILAHPDRYERADENFQDAVSGVMGLDPKTADAMALASGVSRLNSAKRRYNAVRNVEKMLESI